MKSLVTRATSALIALFIFFLVQHYGGKEALILLSWMASTRLAHEYSRMVFNGNWQWLFTGSISVALALLVYPGVNPSALLTALFLLSSIIIILRTHSESHIQESHQRLGRLAFGFLYCYWLPSFIFLLINNEPLILFYILLAIIFVGDTLAYLVGVLIGKHKLKAPISPKKSIEGSIGGLIGATLVSISAMPWSHWDYSTAILIAASVSILGQFGDLLESLIKRFCSVKDSGSIMPGHGGMMDRLDAVYFSAPLYYWLIQTLIIAH